MANTLQQYIEEVAEQTRTRALLALIGKSWLGVIDLDGPLHENGQKCGDETCPCAQEAGVQV